MRIIIVALILLAGCGTHRPLAEEVATKGLEFGINSEEFDEYLGNRNFRSYEISSRKLDAVLITDCWGRARLVNPMSVTEVIGCRQEDGSFTVEYFLAHSLSSFLVSYDVENQEMDVDCDYGEGAAQVDGDGTVSVECVHINANSQMGASE